MSISTALRRAAKLQDKIEELRLELAALLDRARSEVAASLTEEASPLPRRVGRPKMFKSHARRPLGNNLGAAKKPRTSGTAKSGSLRGSSLRKHSPLLGVKRAASPSGPLAPAVVKVLKSKNKPMNVSDILSGLTANGYRFIASEPKKNLAARIYRLSGVKQVAAGLFAAT